MKHKWKLDCDVQWIWQSQAKFPCFTEDWNGLNNTDSWKQKVTSLPSTDKTNYFSIVPSYLPALINDSSCEGVGHGAVWGVQQWTFLVRLCSHTQLQPQGLCQQDLPSRNTPSSETGTLLLPLLSVGQCPKLLLDQTQVCNTGISPSLSSAVIYKIISNLGAGMNPGQEQVRPRRQSFGSAELVPSLPLLSPPERESFLQKEEFFSHQIENNIWFSMKDKMLIFGSPQRKSTSLLFYFTILNPAAKKEIEFFSQPQIQCLVNCFKEIPSAKPPKG